MIHWASIFRGTDYALEPDGLEVLRHYLLEGSAWVVWEGRMDISGCGRQIFRDCQSGKGRAILRQLQLMAPIDPCESDRYTRLIASNEQDGVNAFVGHKHFWRSDMSVHRRPAWYASVKMSSTRVIGAETCNSENMLGLHLGDGVTYFLRTGREYEGLFPVWDWRRLPGTTCRQDQGSLVPNPRACRGQSDFVGGVTDGTRGVAAMEYIRDGLRARKAWFFLDGAVVCLGAGIDCNQPEPVSTCVNQCALDGSVVVCTGQVGRELQQGNHALDGLKWVHHDGMGYILLEPTATGVSVGPRRGNWHAVHHRESRKDVERGVFSLCIEHGVKPEEAQYAYAVFPDVDVSTMPSLSDSPPATILRQTRSIQAISAEDGKLIQAVFFDAGRLTWGEDSFIEVDAPCLITLDRTASVAGLHVADPTHMRTEIGLRLSGRYIGQETLYSTAAGLTEMSVALPSGGMAGKTVSLELRQ
jgi:chondroitin AC lyase